MSTRSTKWLSLGMLAIGLVVASSCLEQEQAKNRSGAPSATANNTTAQQPAVSEEVDPGNEPQQERLAIGENGDGGYAGGARKAGFRERVVFEMQQVLGHEIELRQDAINAAYSAIGSRGTSNTTDQQDQAAYAQARNWGFRIGAFIAAGRQQPFRLEDLASAPLMPLPISSSIRTTTSQSPPTTPEDEADTAAEPVMEAHAANTEQSRERAAAADRLEREVAQLRRSVEKITTQIAHIEHRAATSKPGAAFRQLRQQVLALEQRLATSETSLRDKERQLDALKRDIPLP